MTVCTVSLSGTAHTVAVSTTGEVFAWGYGVFGQLGLGDTDDRLYPTLVVEALDESRVLKAACGALHTLLVSKDGTLWCD